MTDEKYLFVSDVRDKKRNARGSFNKRTHAGKGGAVKFPSDYLTKKEIEAMNGETKTYNINAPMNWQEFKSMPDDIKVMYIKAIRERYGAMNTNIAEMFNVHISTLTKELYRLGLNIGRGRRSSRQFDSEGWCKWMNGIREQIVEEEVYEAEEEVCEHTETEECDEPVRIAVPNSGGMVFEGDAHSIAKSIEQILQNSMVKVWFKWEVKQEDGGQSGRCEVD